MLRSNKLRYHIKSRKLKIIGSKLPKLISLKRGLSSFRIRTKSYRMRLKRRFRIRFNLIRLKVKAASLTNRSCIIKRVIPTSVTRSSTNKSSKPLKQEAKTQRRSKSEIPFSSPSMSPLLDVYQ